MSATAPACFVFVMLFGLSATAEPKAKKCDVSCDASCSRCCASWHIVAVCSDRVVAIGSTHFDAGAAENVAASANQATDGDLRFSCGTDGANARWEARCLGAEGSFTSAEAGARRRLTLAQAAAAEHLHPLLRQLAERPDLKKDAKKRADRLLAALAGYRSALASSPESADTAKVGKDLKDALQLVSDRRAIDPGYEERLRKDAEAKAKADKDREAQLLAKKKAAAAAALAEVEKKEKKENAATKNAQAAAESRTRARAGLLLAGKEADRGLLTAIKFLSQTNLSRVGRSRTEQARARLEDHKRALSKLFQDLGKSDADAQRLEKKANELARKVADERKNVEHLIKDGTSVRR